MQSAFSLNLRYLPLRDVMALFFQGLLIFACGLVHSALEALFGRCCQKLDELIETNPCLDYNTGVVLIRKLTRGDAISSGRSPLFLRVHIVCVLFL